MNVPGSQAASVHFILLGCVMALVVAGCGAQAVLAQTIRGRVLRARRSPNWRGRGRSSRLEWTARKKRSRTLSGRFVLDDVGEGGQSLRYVRSSFAPSVDTVNVRNRSGLEGVGYTLARQVLLDTSRVVATTVYRSPNLRAFESRRERHEAGYFIAEDELRKADEKALASVLAQRVAGLTPSVQGNSVYMMSSRRACTGPAFSTPKSCMPCCVTTYLPDGQLIYLADPGRPDIQPLDFTRIAVKELAAMEFYPSSATAPVQYNATIAGGACGVLLLWSREQ